MERMLYTVCPQCGKRARVIANRWDWDAQQDFVKARCGCGTFEAPYDENRVVDIDLDNPYMEQVHFRLLMPAGMEERTWNMIGGCLMHSWAEEG